MLNEEIVIATQEEKYFIGVRTDVFREEELDLLLETSRKKGRVDKEVKQVGDDLCSLMFRIYPEEDLELLLEELKQSARTLYSNEKKENKKFRIESEGGEYCVVFTREPENQRELSNLNMLLEDQNKVLSSAIKDYIIEREDWDNELKEKVSQDLKDLYISLEKRIGVTEEEIVSGDRGSKTAAARSVIARILRGKYGSRLSDSRIGVMLNKTPTSVYMRRNRFNGLKFCKKDYSNLDECVQKALEAYTEKIVLNS